MLTIRRVDSKDVVYKKKKSAKVNIKTYLKYLKEKYEAEFIMNDLISSLESTFLEIYLEKAAMLELKSALIPKHFAGNIYSGQWE